MARFYCDDDGSTLNADFFRGSGPELLRNPIFFVIFQGGGGGRTPCPSSGSAQVFF